MVIIFIVFLVSCYLRALSTARSSSIIELQLTVRLQAVVYTGHGETVINIHQCCPYEKYILVRVQPQVRMKSSVAVYIPAVINLSVGTAPVSY